MDSNSLSAQVKAIGDYGPAGQAFHGTKGDVNVQAVCLFSPTKFVDNFVGNWVSGPRKVAPHRGFNRLMKN
jgi:hypothetical protein